MATTVATLIARIALDLHETPGSFPPGRNNLWTLAEVVDNINYAERDFLRRTGILKTDTNVVVPPGTQLQYSVPATIIDIERMSFNYKALERVTAWDLEREDPAWRVHPNDKAEYYHSDRLPMGKFELNSRPATGGTLRIFGDTMPTAHTTAGIASETIVVRDTWEQYIRWEVLSLMLGKDGDNQDLARSAYAHQRYLMGCALAYRMITGREDIVVGEGKNA